MSAVEGSADTASAIYQVVRNDEEQYSIWPADREPPAGWHGTGYRGVEDDCLAHIDEVWTDLRPLSLRKAMAAAAQAEPADESEVPPTPRPDLVARLCEGEHEVEVVLRPEPTPQRLRTAIESGYLHLRFPNTNGGTELGVALSTADCELSEADLAAGTGTGRLSGTLTLDFEQLGLTADLDLGTRTGQARLQRR